MDGAFLADVAAHRPELLNAMLAFNRRHRKTLPLPDPFARLGSLGSALWEDDAIRRLCSPAPHDEGWWDFAEESSRLALLDAGLLKKVSRYFSAAILSDDIAHVIAHDELAELKKRLGADLHAYALRRGRYQAGSLRLVFLPLAKGENLADQVEYLSNAALLITASAWPVALKIFLLRHDPACYGFLDGKADSVPLPSPSQAIRRSVWFTMKKILLREVAPEWAPCFD